jgi:hypothetical protein
MYEIKWTALLSDSYKVKNENWNDVLSRTIETVFDVPNMCTNSILKDIKVILHSDIQKKKVSFFDVTDEDVVLMCYCNLMDI